MKRINKLFNFVIGFFSKSKDDIKPNIHLHFDYNIYGKCKCNVIKTNSLYNEYNFESSNSNEYDDSNSIIFSYDLIHDLSNSIFSNYDYDIIEKCLNFAKQKFQIYESSYNFIITRYGIMIGGREDMNDNVGCSDFFKLHKNIHAIEKSYKEYKKIMENHPTKLIISVD